MESRGLISAGAFWRCILHYALHRHVSGQFPPKKTDMNQIIDFPGATEWTSLNLFLNPSPQQTLISPDCGIVVVAVNATFRNPLRMKAGIIMEVRDGVGKFTKPYKFP